MSTIFINLSTLFSMENINYKKEYSKQIKSMENLIKASINHCLLVCPDTCLLDKLLISLKKNFETTFESIKEFNTINFKSKYTNTLLFIKIDNKDAKLAQKTLYYYLEESLENEDNFYCFYTNKVNTVEEMEKRVRSRFNNEVIFFPFLSLSVFKNIIKKEKIIVDAKKIEYIHNINPSISNLNNFLFLQKYNIKKIELQNIYQILSNLHLVILILSHKEILKNNNVVTKFRKFIIGYSELKNTASTDILKAYIELNEYGLIKNKFYGDWFAFQDFINTNSPFYIRSLFKKI